MNPIAFGKPACAPRFGDVRVTANTAEELARTADYITSSRLYDAHRRLMDDVLNRVGQAAGKSPGYQGWTLEGQITIFTHDAADDAAVTDIIQNDPKLKDEVAVTPIDRFNRTVPLVPRD